MAWPVPIEPNSKSNQDVMSSQPSSDPSTPQTGSSSSGDSSMSSQGIQSGPNSVTTLPDTSGSETELPNNSTPD